MLYSLVTRLRAYLSVTRTKPYKPDFSDAAFFGCLSQREELPETLKPAVSDFFSSKPLDACHKVMLHFRSRAHPRFFIDLHEIPKLAHAIRQNHPSWYDAQLKKIVSDCDTGLAIYSVTAPPLKPVFPWQAPAQGHENDLLYPVRPHRFAFAPRMALVGLFEPSMIERLAAIVRDWLSFAQKGKSNLPYVSNLVVIQRLLAVCWTWAYLAARPIEGNHNALQLEWELIKLMRVDVEYLKTRLGTSYPNNHLLVDQFAGWYIAQWLPEFSGAKALVEAEAKWLQELRRQTLSDGTGFEHSIHYHEFACEMALAYHQLSARNQREIPRWFENRFIKMLSFQADMCGPYALPPAIGNTTEDPLFPLDARESGASAAWWEIHRALFDPERLPLVAVDNPCVERAAWLLGRDPSSATSCAQTTSCCLQGYPEGGFFVFCELDRSSRLIFRTGPALNTDVSAGHMHADLLSLYLTVDDESVLVDAGTYTYRNIVERGVNSSVNWRQYFVGPFAHNGPAIEKLDPHGILFGDFRLPSQSARVKLARNRSQSIACWVEACIVSLNEYDGFSRGVVFIPGQYFVVYDAAPPSALKLDISYGFQFSLASKVATNAESIVGDTNGKPWEITASRGLRFASLLKGSTEPLGGWVSTEYGNIVSAPQTRFRNDHYSLTTAFLVRVGKQVQYGAVPTIDINTSRAGNLALRISMGKTIDYLILRRANVTDANNCWGIDFDGDLLWLRTRDFRVEMLRWLDGRSAKCQDMGLRIEATLPLHSLELQALPTRTPLPPGFTHCEMG